MKNNVNLLCYFLSRCLFLGAGLSIIFLNSGKDTYISAFLGILLGIGIIYIFSKVLNKISVPIHEYLKGKKFLNILIKIIYLSYLLFLSFILLLIISTFIYSYFLPYTPSLVSCLPLIFLACYLNSKSSKNIAYIGFILMIFSLVIIALKTSLLANEFDFNNLLPILSTKPINVFKSSLIYAILSTAPFLTMTGEKIEFKQMLKYYLIASIGNFVVLLSVTLTSGEMISVYSYPEYSVLRKIRFFNFIENIENIISASWFFDIFICLSLTSLKIKETFNFKKSLIPFLIIALIMGGVHKYISDNFYNSMVIYKTFPYIISGLILILLILFTIKNMTKKKGHQST